MPGFIELKSKNFAFKYDLESGYNIRYEHLKKTFGLRIQATSSKELLKVLKLGGGRGMIPVAAIGIGAVFLKDNVKVPSWPIAWKSVIFETVIPVDKEDEFDRYITEELADEMNVLFSNVDTHLRKYLGDEVDKIDEDFLAALKKTKITEVRLCDEEEVQKAKEAGLTAEAERARPPPPKNLSLKKTPKSSTTLLAFYDKPQDGDVDGYIVTANSFDARQLHEVHTEDDFAVLSLKPGQMYLFWVQSVKKGVRSDKCVLRDSVKTAVYVSKKHDLWNSDLHGQLMNIFGHRIPDKRMDQLLGKCLELGIVEVNDLKFFVEKEVRDEMKETLKVVEILKLVDYAQRSADLEPYVDQAKSLSRAIDCVD